MEGLKPARTKYPTRFRGRLKGLAYRGKDLNFGEYALKSVSRGLITSAQIEAARKVIRHHAHKGGRLWIRIFPDKPITLKPPETRMGSGKAPIDHYSAVIRPGLILFELAGVNQETAKRALILAGHKLSVATQFAKKD